ncbi:hypothetical protein [Streptosporangium vulgare]|uniref:hypothetical protein n=1 Tax=Streptosporangium vulgare TaxID=46190 RepID=UPI0031D97F32
MEISSSEISPRTRTEASLSAKENVSGWLSERGSPPAAGTGRGETTGVKEGVHDDPGQRVGDVGRRSAHRRVGHGRDDVGGGTELEQDPHVHHRGSRRSGPTTFLHPPRSRPAVEITP